MGPISSPQTSIWVVACQKWLRSNFRIIQRIYFFEATILLFQDFFRFYLFLTCKNHVEKAHFEAGFEVSFAAPTQKLAYCTLLSRTYHRSDMGGFGSHGSQLLRLRSTGSLEYLFRGCFGLSNRLTHFEHLISRVSRPSN